MALFYAALAFLLGLALGRAGLSLSSILCPLPAWLWLLPLLCLPATPLLNRLQPKRPPPPMRWPASAGFAEIRHLIGVILPGNEKAKLCSIESR